MKKKGREYLSGTKGDWNEPTGSALSISEEKQGCVGSVSPYVEGDFTIERRAKGSGLEEASGRSGPGSKLKRSRLKRAASHLEGDGKEKRIGTCKLNGHLRV